MKSYANDMRMDMLKEELGEEYRIFEMIKR